MRTASVRVPFVYRVGLATEPTQFQALAFAKKVQAQKILISLEIRILRFSAFCARGAAGDRTPVQTSNKKAFYMLSLRLFFDW